MMEFIELIMRPQFVVTILAAISAFVTVLTIALPIMSSDRINQRMKLMATERAKMRAERMADMASERPGNNLRKTPKGYMQEVVDQLNLRKHFDSDEVRAKLKMAGLRGQAPLVTYMFFRIAMPIVLFVSALSYLFVLSELAYPPIIKFAMALGVGFVGYYVPNLFVHNMTTKRQKAIKEAFPDALETPGHLVGVRLGSLPLLDRRPLDIDRVLVGSHQEVNIVSGQPVKPGQRVGGNLFVSRTQMRVGIHIVDRAGDVEGFAHEIATSSPMPFRFRISGYRTRIR